MSTYTILSVIAKEEGRRKKKEGKKFGSSSYSSQIITANGHLLQRRGTSAMQFSHKWQGLYPMRS
ncbi:hypothetical protein Riv7116_6152 [Rivularia sp. PCC 7116]|nr:hypothetical protein Riv7116_6152 [Rivularia sp. PCC 7116]